MVPTFAVISMQVNRFDFRDMDDERMIWDGELCSDASVCASLELSIISIPSKLSRSIILARKVWSDCTVQWSQN